MPLLRNFGEHPRVVESDIRVAVCAVTYVAKRRPDRIESVASLDDSPYVIRTGSSDIFGRNFNAESPVDFEFARARRYRVLIFSTENSRSGKACNLE